MSIQKHMNEAHVSVVQQDPGAFSNFQVIKVINIVPAQWKYSIKWLNELHELKIKKV